MNAGELIILAALPAIFSIACCLPRAHPRVEAVTEAFRLLRWCARMHTLTRGVPALFIAGGRITFLSREMVMRYLGPRTQSPAAQSVAVNPIIVVIATAVDMIVGAMHAESAGAVLATAAPPAGRNGSGGPLS